MTTPKSQQDSLYNPFEEPEEQDSLFNPFEESGPQVVTPAGPQPPSRQNVKRGLGLLLKGGKEAVTGFPASVKATAKVTTKLLQDIDEFFSVRTIRDPAKRMRSRQEILKGVGEVKAMSIDPLARVVSLPQEYETLSDEEFEVRMKELGGVLAMFGAGALIGRGLTGKAAPKKPGMKVQPSGEIVVEAPTGPPPRLPPAPTRGLLPPPPRGVIVPASEIEARALSLEAEEAGAGVTEAVRRQRLAAEAQRRQAIFEGRQPPPPLPAPLVPTPPPPKPTPAQQLKRAQTKLTVKPKAKVAPKVSPAEGVEPATTLAAPVRALPPLPQGDPWAVRGQTGYIPTVQAVKFAKELLGKEEFERRVRAQPQVTPEATTMTRALAVENTARNAMKDATAPPEAPAPAPAPVAPPPLPTEKLAAQVAPEAVPPAPVPTEAAPPPAAAPLPAVPTLQEQIAIVNQRIDALDAMANEGTITPQQHIEGLRTAAKEKVQLERQLPREQVVLPRYKAPDIAGKNLTKVSLEKLKDARKYLTMALRDRSFRTTPEGKAFELELARVEEAILAKKRLSEGGWWQLPIRGKAPQQAMVSAESTPSMRAQLAEQLEKLKERVRKSGVPEREYPYNELADRELLDLLRYSNLPEYKTRLFEGEMVPVSPLKTIQEALRRIQKYWTDVEDIKAFSPDEVEQALTLLNPLERRLLRLSRDPEGDARFQVQYKKGYYLSSPEQRAMNLQAQAEQLAEAVMVARSRLPEAGFLRLPFGKKKFPPTPPSTAAEKWFSEHMKASTDIAPQHWIKRLWKQRKAIASKAYMGVARPSHGANVFTELAESKLGFPVRAAYHPGKLIDMPDASMHQAEVVLRDEGPFLFDAKGEPQPTGTPPLSQIIESSGGDPTRFDWVRAALRHLDRGRLGRKTFGIPDQHAIDIARNATPAEINAVKDVRQYHLDLARLVDQVGGLKPGSIERFAEEVAYGPVQYIFDEEFIKGLQTVMRTKGMTPEEVVARTPIHEMRGMKGEVGIRRFTESDIDMTYRILRFVHLQRVANAIEMLAEAVPELRGMAERLEHPQQVAFNRDVSERARLAKAMFKEEGMDVQMDDMETLTMAMSDDALGLRDGVLRYIKNGEPAAMRLDPLLAQSVSSLSYQPMPKWVRAAGAVASVSRAGIAAHPMFQLQMLSLDQLQAWFNTRYGVKMGYDTLRGLAHVVGKTPQAKAVKRAGGLSRHIGGKMGLEELFVGPEQTALTTLERQIKEMHPMQAIAHLEGLFREGTRMGESLRALEAKRGQTEAAWAGRDLLGNYSTQGTFATIRALTMMSRFGRAGIATLDKTLRVARENPKRWLGKMGVLAGAAYILYMAQEDDEDIQRLRRAPGGSRWIYYRLRPGGQIRKWRKPFVEGAIAMNGVEAMLDAQKEQDPQAFKEWRDAVLREITVNMAPVIFQLPAELITKTSGWPARGAPIVPGRQEGTDPIFQSGRANTFERELSRRTGGVVSPAILSHVIQSLGGTLGTEASKLIAGAIDWVNTGELPPEEDFPLTERLAARYPTLAVRDVRDYYEKAAKVRKAAESMEDALRQPETLPYIFDKYKDEVGLIDEFKNAQQDISTYRAMIDGTEEQYKTVGPQTRKRITDYYTRLMVERMAAVNRVVKLQQQAREAASAAQQQR